MSDDPELLERQLIELFTLAGEYCLALEKAEHSSKDELYHFLLKISPILYLRGLLLPQVQEPEEDGNERIVTQEQWESVFNTLRGHFGEEDLFFYLDDESIERTDYQKGSLSEFFADIYQDMKDFAWLMSKGTQLSREYAAFNLKNYFITNWGQKLLQVQLILHQRLVSKPVLDEEYDLE